MRSIALLIVSGALLGGCGVGVEQDMSDVRAADAAQCTAYGFKEGTQGFANCRMELDRLRIADQSQKNAVITNSLLNRR